MEKRKNNSTKNKNVVKKVAKKTTAKKNWKSNGIFDEVIGVFNVVACLVAGGVMGWYWHAKIETWEVLVGILAFALVIWLNMIHVIGVKEEKQDLSDMKMAIFGGAKVVFYWILIHTLVMMASGLLIRRVPIQFYDVAFSALQAMELVLFVTVTLMHFAMMKNLGMKWGGKLYIWMLIWSLAAMLCSGFMTFYSNAGVLFGVKIGFVIYLAQMAVFVTLFAGVIGEVYKKIADRKK